MNQGATAYINQEHCSGCGECLAVCSWNAISIVEGTARVDPSLCRGCGICSDNCPSRAISLLYPARQPISIGYPTSLPANRPDPKAGMAIARQAATREGSLLARAVRTVAPVALNLALALGQAWLDRASASGVSGSNRPATACQGRRRRKRGGP